VLVLNREGNWSKYEHINVNLLKRLALTAILCFTAFGNAFGNLGDSAHTAALRYGNATKEYPVLGKHCALYYQNGWTICHVYNDADRCIYATFGLLGGDISPKEALQIIYANTGEDFSKWTAAVRTATGTTWVSPSGQFFAVLEPREVIVFDREGNQIVVDFAQKHLGR
jgi:hypothetical protein